LRLSKQTLMGDAGDIESAIQKRYDSINKYALTARKYFQQISNIIEGTNIQEFRATLENLDILERSKPPQILLTANAAGMQLVNAIWNDFKNLYVVMDAVEKTIIGDYSQKAIFSMSQSAGVEFKLLRSSLINLRDRISAEAVSSDTAIFAKLFKTYDRTDCIEFLLVDKSVNSFTTAMMFHLMQYGTASDKSRLQRLVEDRKNSVLGSSTIVLTGNAFDSIPIMRYVPVSDFCTLGVISTILGAKPCESVDALSRYIDANIILLHRGTANNLAFDVRGLLSREYIAPIYTKPSSGLTKKFIKRFTTAVKLDPAEPGPVKKYSTGSTSSGKFCLLETFSNHTLPDGAKTYRILGDSVGKYYFSSEPRLSTVSSRPRDYNEILSKKILDQYMDPAAEGLLNNAGEVLATKPSEPIKNKVINKFMDRVEHTLIDDDYETYRQLFVNWEELNSVVSDAMLVTVGKLPTPEVLLTYLTKLDDICKIFSEELVSTFAELGIKPSLFAQLSKEDLRQQSRDTAKIIIKTATDQLDQGDQWTKYALSLKEYFIDKKFENV